jgi:hypothetical protein
MEVDEADDRYRSPRSRKNRRRWCKGKVGVEHVPGEPVPGTHGGWRLHHGVPLCDSAPEWAHTLVGLWWCNHQVRCERCARVLVDGLGEKCPDIPPEMRDR